MSAIVQTFRSGLQNPTRLVAKLWFGTPMLSCQTIRFGTPTTARGLGANNSECQTVVWHNNSECQTVVWHKKSRCQTMDCYSVDLPNYSLALRYTKWWYNRMFTQ